MGSVSDKRVVMAKSVALQWLERHASAEYRLNVLYGHPDGNGKKLPRLFKAFRDGKIKLGGMDSLPDLGIRTGFDSVEIWSSDREQMLKVQDWLVSKGYETSGVW